MKKRRILYKRQEEAASSERDRGGTFIDEMKNNF